MVIGSIPELLTEAIDSDQFGQMGPNELGRFSAQQTGVAC
jgi:hypothetical protein